MTMTKTRQDYETMQHEDAIDYSLGLMEYAAYIGDHATLRAARESIVALYRHKTHDYGTMTVACVMHPRQVEADGYLFTAFDHNGYNSVATWSLHS